MASEDKASNFIEHWTEKYGTAFYMPIALGQDQLMLSDPKAVAHIYANDTYGYTQMGFAALFLEMLVGKGVIWAEGDAHKRWALINSNYFVNCF